MPSTREPADIPVLFIYNIDPTWEPREKKEAFTSTEKLVSSMTDMGHPSNLLEVNDKQFESSLKEFNPNKYIVFNLFEEIPGVPHSEYLAATIIESMKFTYTGSPPDVIMRSEDKRIVKSVLASHRIKTPKWKVYETSNVSGWDCYPAIVKVAVEHSSLGINTDSVVMNERELRAKVESVLDTYKEPALVEDFIDGREFHVSIWGNGVLEMLPIAEMDFSALDDVHCHLCTYDAKHMPESTLYNSIQTIIPAVLSEDQHERLEKVAMDSYRAIGCRDYARLDIRLRDNEFYVLDINPNADLSYDASIASSAELAGYTYGEMGSRIVKLAAKRHPYLC
jgi:D-alanine-D-alanine ligase